MNMSVDARLPPVLRRRGLRCMLHFAAGVQAVAPRSIQHAAENLICRLRAVISCFACSAFPVTNLTFRARVLLGTGAHVNERDSRYRPDRKCIFSLILT